ncbi:hypothetical protein KAX75_07750 [candidate division WOR-3 bacterium]|nr:hypothetical protein [candidate division WOR-3 bacterium]
MNRNSKKMIWWGEWVIMVQSVSVVICEISGKNDLVVRMGNYDTIRICGYL